MFSSLIQLCRCLAVVVVALNAAGCAGGVAPAIIEPKSGGSAPPGIEEQAGVRVAVTVGRWSGVPEELPELASPLYVTIQNNSNRALRVRYDAFELTGADGKLAAAQPPYDLETDGAVVKPVLLPKNYLAPEPGFTPAPHCRTPDNRTFFPRHPWNYDEYTPRYNLWAYPLPTQDMLAKGIPEGVLDPGGTVAGFLYFPKLPEDARRLAFEMQLVDASTGKSFDEIRIPLPVR